MNREQIETLYKANGLTDYKLQTIEDIRKVHGIDCKNVTGYDSLDDLNRANYERFILKFFNGCGLESRATIKPQGIYWVEEIEYAVPEEDYFIIAAGVIYSIDRNGQRTKLHEWQDEAYKAFEKIAKEPENYLRFEYQHRGRKEWLHVIKNGSEWY